MCMTARGADVPWNYDLVFPTLMVNKIYDVAVVVSMRSQEPPCVTEGADFENRVKVLERCLKK